MTHDLANYEQEMAAVVTAVAELADRLRGHGYSPESIVAGFTSWGIAQSVRLGDPAEVAGQLRTLADSTDALTFPQCAGSA